MIFKPGDIVIFKDYSAHISYNNKFTKDKEYIILSKRNYNNDNFDYILVDDYNTEIIIYGGSILLSPRYVRNETIENILS